ncbi:hypothetical protein [Pyxidicoccus sp. MSG2]|uniref:hypothetical protein n=1 Tax=Pyxidicoccus sp. MSG2 TaxID=2996790 RepID=UPI002270E2BB|nr:hypothetical protein [Pyxidicoccus sp. MSG2]MCY1023914.1 hypothetical protein [Pyxidicoccus sp. MSG2]
MFITCTNPRVHEDDHEPCASCGLVICSHCNQGPRCATGCPPVDDSMTVEEKVEQPRENLKRRREEPSGQELLLEERELRQVNKRRRRVFLFEHQEKQSHDTLRVGTSGVSLYAKVLDIEKEWRGRTVIAHHVLLEGILAEWFHDLAEDLSNLPDHEDWPAKAGRCKLDMALEVPVFETLTSHLALVEMPLEAGLWLRLGIGPRGGDSRNLEGLPLRIFLPPEKGTRLGLVAVTERFSDRYVITSVDAVQQSSPLGEKLDRFSGRYD